MVEHFDLTTGPVLDEDVLETILRESVVMSNFNHPRLVSLIGLCLNSRTNPIVVLPFMMNGNLRTYIKDKSRVVTIYISFCYQKCVVAVDICIVQFSFLFSVIS